MNLNQHYLSDYGMIYRDHEGLTETLMKMDTTQVDRLIQAQKEHELYHERCAKGIALTRANKIIEGTCSKPR